MQWRFEPTAHCKQLIHRSELRQHAGFQRAVRLLLQYGAFRGPITGEKKQRNRWLINCCFPSRWTPNYSWNSLQQHCSLSRCKAKWNRQQESNFHLCFECSSRVSKRHYSTARSIVSHCRKTWTDFQVSQFVSSRSNRSEIGIDHKRNVFGAQTRRMFLLSWVGLIDWSRVLDFGGRSGRNALDVETGESKRAIEGIGELQIVDAKTCSLSGDKEGGFRTSLSRVLKFF